MECGRRLAPLRLWCCWQDPSGTCLCTGHPEETQLVTTLWERYIWKLQFTTERGVLVLSFSWCLLLCFLISWICHSWAGPRVSLMNVPRYECATVALSDCRLLHLLAAVYRKLCCWKQNDWCSETAVLPLLWWGFFMTAGWLMVDNVLCCFCQTQRGQQSNSSSIWLESP